MALLSTACNRGPQHYLDVANKLAAQGNYADADLNYRKAIQKNADFGEAYYQLGLMNVKLGKVLPAYQTLLTAAQPLFVIVTVISTLVLPALTAAGLMVPAKSPRVIFAEVAVGVVPPVPAAEPLNVKGLVVPAALIW